MAWLVDAGDGLVVYSADGLTSLLTDDVEAWVRSRGNQVDVDPVHSTVTYDANNESIVLAATLNYLTDVFASTPTLLESSVDPYVAGGPEVDAVRGIDY